MMPVEQKSDKVGGTDGSDLATQAAKRKPMNTSKQTTVTPFVVPPRKLASKHLARRLQPRQGCIDDFHRQPKAFAQSGCCCRTRRLEPTTYSFHGCRIAIHRLGFLY